MADTFPIRRVDHVRFLVGNAKASAYYYHKVFGFDIVGYDGLETGLKHEVDWLLRQGNVRFLFTAPSRPGHPLNEQLNRSGDGVMDIAFEVDDVDWAFETAVARGAKPAKQPWTMRDDRGEVRLAAIHTYGDTIHTFLNRDKFSGAFLPGFQDRDVRGHSTGLLEVDHAVGNVELGQMNVWVKFYEQVLGFTQLISFDDKDISTEYTALMSKVMSNGNGKVKFPINEPAAGKKKSQIDEYLEFYGGAGVQHIALLTEDIIRTVTELRNRGIEFLQVPKAYYELLPERVGQIDEAISELEDLGILVDRDEEGYLLQIFTKPVTDRPTLFYEIIERKGAKSFGKGNFKALFEAIEREQAVRGTL